jgi:lipopolysaccharide/colanic/teichoic acid biosynthesis glycosyltransferase
MVEADIDYMELSAPHIFDEWYAYYQASRPGLAGASQIYRHHFRDGHDQTIYRRSAELDLEYFDRASLVTDLRVLAKAPIDMLMANTAVVDNSQVGQHLPAGS